LKLLKSLMKQNLKFPGMKKVTCIKVFGLNMARMFYSREKIKPQIHLSGSKSHVVPLGSKAQVYPSNSKHEVYPQILNQLFSIEPHV